VICNEEDTDGRAVGDSRREVSTYRLNRDAICVDVGDYIGRL